VIDQVRTLHLELSLESGLAGEVVVEVMLGESDDKFTEMARIVLLLTLDARCHGSALRALVEILAAFTRRKVGVLVQLHEDGVNVIVNGRLAILGFLRRVAVIDQVLTLHVELSLESGLIGDIVVEVVLSDVDDDFAGAARIVHLTLLTLRHHRALFAVQAGLMAWLAGAQIVVDCIDELINEICAVCARLLSFDLANTRALPLELHLERILVSDIVVEVVTSDVHDDLARTALIRLAALREPAAEHSRNDCQKENKSLHCQPVDLQSR
jgi:hypothetical protein